jgi:hypothetical protein
MTAWVQWVQLWVGVFGVTSDNSLKGMAGTTGLEPAASAVTVLLAKMQRMRRNECKLHTLNKLAQFSPSATWTDKYQFTPTCTGMDEGVTSQVTSHNFLPESGS